MKNDISLAIDAGTHTSKLAGANKFIAAIRGRDLLKIREEAEIYFDEPVFSCVIAVPENFSKRQHDDLILNAKKSGFKNIELIKSHNAILNALDENDKHKKILVYDFGASKSEFIFFDNGEVIESEIISDICGNEFDKIFASWLRERFNLSLISDSELQAKAEKFKLEISENNFTAWRDVEITRENFERLIYFSVKRAAHVTERFIDCYSPEKFIMTGGCTEMEVVKKVFAGFKPEFNKNLIALGVAGHANSLSSAREKNKRLDNSAKLSEIRGTLISIEDFLTRKQKDRLYKLFRQIEAPSVNAPALIKLLENLIKDIAAAYS